MLNGLDKIEGLTPEQQEAINGLAGGLVDKNTELLGKLSNSENLSAAEKAKLTELETFKSNAEIQAAKDAEKWNEASQLQHEAWEKEKNELIESKSNYESQLKTLLIDNGLSAALDGVDINKNLKDGAVAMLQSGAKIVDGKAMIGDKSLSDAVKEWSQTDAGKAFCNAPQNQGGNASGGSNGQSTSNKEWSKMSTKEKAAHLANK